MAIFAYTPDQASAVDEFVAFNEAHDLGENNVYQFKASLSNGLWGLNQIDNTPQWNQIVPGILPTFETFDVSKFKNINPRLFPKFKITPPVEILPNQQ